MVIEKIETDRESLDNVPPVLKKVGCFLLIPAAIAAGFLCLLRHITEKNLPGSFLM
jgi:hypothetical protein